MVDWNNQNTTKLMDMWMGGHSALQIAKALGGDATRNAVIGKITRLGLNSKTQGRLPSVRQEPATPQKRRAPQTTYPTKSIVQFPPIPADKSPIDKPAPVVFEGACSAMRPCCWPIGDPRDESFGFCGAPSLDKRPYCPAHTAKATDQKSRPFDPRRTEKFISATERRGQFRLV